MEKTRIEDLISNWNRVFPNYQLTSADLKKPSCIIGALFQIFDRLGIDRDAVLTPPPEENCNEHTIYYWDLLPVINMTRVFNHLVAVIPQVDATITITQFLQPSLTSSHSILLMLINLMVFNEDRLNDIAPHEEVLFSKSTQVKALDDRKNRLLEMLNEQYIEKEKRAERLEKLDRDIKQLEEELKKDKGAHGEDKQEFEAVLKENKQIEIILDQKKGQKDALIAEIEKKRALRVYDADDIKAQVKQAAQNVQDAEEKLKSLQATLSQKERSLMNLQNIKPNLDTANNLLHEIMKLVDSLRDCESGDLELDSKEGELDVLGTELGELQAALAELQAARTDAAAQRQETRARRQRDKGRKQSALREAEEKDKKCREKYKKATERLQEIKECTANYEKAKAEGIEEIARINESFTAELKSMEETLLKKAVESEKKIEEKLKNRCL